ncbi:MAG: c-type cytochrome [Steroidobacteraceae bacterium]|jgi:cytochrome c553
MRLCLFATLVAGTFVAGTAWSAGSVEAGTAKSVVCQACHGATGNSVNPDWPSLAGLGADYIAQQLQNFKDAKRSNPIMNPMAMSLSADDMADLGAYFGSQKNIPLEPEPQFMKAGAKLYRGGDTARNIPACMACHGPDGAGIEAAKFPALRGQQSGYFVKQLHDYASGARATGPNNIMQTIAARLSEDDMRDLAAYIKGIR